MASMWDKVKNAQASQTGIYFVVPSTKIGDSCKYKVKITMLKSVEGQSSDFAVIETEIVESVVPERAPGSKCSQLINMRQEMGPVNAKMFVAALFGINSNLKKYQGDSGAVALTTEIERIGSDLLGRSLDISALFGVIFSGDEESPFNGEVMTLTATNILTKKKKELFTRIDWDPNPDASTDAA